MTNQELPSTTTTDSNPSPVWVSSITIGLGSSICMWMIAWLLHLPGAQVPSGISIPLLLIPLFFLTFMWTKNLPATQRIKTGAISGLIAGTVNLMILGSKIVEQPETTAQMDEQANSLAPNALMTIFGSLIISGVVGLIAGLLSSKSNSETKPKQIWLSRLGWVTAISYLPLIAVGGAVTTTDSGLAVPDAVTSYGAISVLFPLELMSEPRIFLEHSHRLFGTLSGLATLVFMIRTLISEKRTLPKIFVTILFVAVCLQGYLGIIRVADESTFFAIIHGVFAQLVLGLAFGTALVLSTRWIECSPSEESKAAAKKGRTLIAMMTLGLIIQLCLGAVTRHMNSGHAMMAHMGFAMIAMMLTILGGAICMRVGKTDKSGSAIRPFGAVLHGLVVLQFTLGFAVLGMGWSSEDVSELPTSETLAQAAPIETGSTLVTSAHHIIGALVLAAAIGAFFWVLRLSSAQSAD